MAIQKPTNQPINETALKNQILDYLAYKGVFCWMTNTMGNYNKITGTYYKNPRLKAGIADILAIWKPYGTLIAIECKVGKNRTTAAQDEFKNDLVAAGGVYIVAYDLDDIVKQPYF